VVSLKILAFEQFDFGNQNKFNKKAWREFAGRLESVDEASPFFCARVRGVCVPLDCHGTASDGHVRRSGFGVAGVTVCGIRGGGCGVLSSEEDSDCVWTAA
jgi:hypothetical protein